jgi:uncharacterized protein (DUF983 family)
MVGNGEAGADVTGDCPECGNLILYDDHLGYRVCVECSWDEIGTHEQGPAGP